jgi:RHH-type transcriptional regulator, rel operon repressor / antitoxin RelB
MLALRLPEDLEARLDALAKKTGRTKSFYAREAISEYIDDLEDLYLAQKRQALRERGKTLTVSIADVEKSLGLAD